MKQKKKFKRSLGCALALASVLTGAAGLTLVGCQSNTVPDAGTQWHIETGAPTESTSGKIGDLYLDKDNFDLYMLTADGWEKIGTLKGDDGQPGEQGQGMPGKSAYEIAVEHGYTGTEEEWLESLHGEGGSGSGKSAYDIAVENGFEGTEEEWLASLAGRSVEDVKVDYDYDDDGTKYFVITIIYTDGTSQVVRTEVQKSVLNFYFNSSELRIGESFNLIVQYEDGTNALVDGFDYITNLEEIDFVNGGSQNVHVKYRGRTYSQEVNVAAITAIKSVDTEYSTGYTGEIKKLRVFFENGTNADVDIKVLAGDISGIDFATAGTQTGTLNYRGATLPIELQIVDVDALAEDESVTKITAEIRAYDKRDNSENSESEIYVLNGELLNGEESYARYKNAYVQANYTKEGVNHTLLADFTLNLFRTYSEEYVETADTEYDSDKTYYILPTDEEKDYYGSGYSPYSNYIDNNYRQEGKELLTTCYIQDYSVHGYVPATSFSWDVSVLNATLKEDVTEENFSGLRYELYYLDGENYVNVGSNDETFDAEKEYYTIETKGYSTWLYEHFFNERTLYEKHYTFKASAETLKNKLGYYNVKFVGDQRDGYNYTLTVADRTDRTLDTYFNSKYDVGQNIFENASLHIYQNFYRGNERIQTFEVEYLYGLDKSMIVEGSLDETKAGFYSFKIGYKGYVSQEFIVQVGTAEEIVESLDIQETYNLVLTYNGEDYRKFEINLLNDGRAAVVGKNLQHDQDADIYFTSYTLLDDNTLLLDHVDDNLGTLISIDPDTKEATHYILSSDAAVYSYAILNLKVENNILFTKNGVDYYAFSFTNPNNMQDISYYGYYEGDTFVGVAIDGDKIYVRDGKFFTNAEVEIAGAKFIADGIEKDIMLYTNHYLYDMGNYSEKLTDDMLVKKDGSITSLSEIDWAQPGQYTLTVLNHIGEETTLTITLASQDNVTQEYITDYTRYVSVTFDINAIDPTDEMTDEEKDAYYDSLISSKKLEFEFACFDQNDVFIGFRIKELTLKEFLALGVQGDWSSTNYQEELDNFKAALLAGEKSTKTFDINVRCSYYGDDPRVVDNNGSITTFDFTYLIIDATTHQGQFTNAETVAGMIAPEKLLVDLYDDFALVKIDFMGDNLVGTTPYMFMDEDKNYVFVDATEISDGMLSLVFRIDWDNHLLYNFVIDETTATMYTGTLDGAEVEMAVFDINGEIWARLNVMGMTLYTPLDIITKTVTVEGVEKQIKLITLFDSMMAMLDDENHAIVEIKPNMYNDEDNNNKVLIMLGIDGNMFAMAGVDGENIEDFKAKEFVPAEVERIDLTIHNTNIDILTLTSGEQFVKPDTDDSGFFLIQNVKEFTLTEEGQTTTYEVFKLNEIYVARYNGEYHFADYDEEGNTLAVDMDFDDYDVENVENFTIDPETNALTRVENP